MGLRRLGNGKGRGEGGESGHGRTEPPPRPTWLYAAIGVAMVIVAAVVLWLLLAGDDGLLEVPDVVGLPRQEAEARLADAGMRVEVIIVRDHREGVDIPPEGQVISQDPEAGTRVERGSFVSIRVSAGPL